MVVGRRDRPPTPPVSLPADSAPFGHASGRIAMHPPCMGCILMHPACIATA